MKCFLCNFAFEYIFFTKLPRYNGLLVDKVIGDDREKDDVEIDRSNRIGILRIKNSTMRD